MVLRHFVGTDGVDRYNEWFDTVRDLRAKLAILKRLDRLAEGNFGQVRALRKGVWEIKIDVGAGFRVYYALSGKTIILLLCGGDKTSQTADINRAVGYWEDFQKRERS